LATTILIYAPKIPYVANFALTTPLSRTSYKNCVSTALPSSIRFISDATFSTAFCVIT